MRLINNSFGLGQRLQAFPLTLSRGITEPNISEREIKVEQQLTEQWKSIKNYEGLYEISNYGRVKSCAKKWICGNHDSVRQKEATILRYGTDGMRGYLKVILANNKKNKSHYIHTLVWDHFGDRPRNGRKLQVDHKDDNKLNNRVDNLQLLTTRENTSKYHKTQKETSEYVGVHWNSGRNKWIAKIMIDGKSVHLGYFTNEYNAHLAYQKALNKIGGKNGN